MFLYSYKESFDYLSYFFYNILRTVIFMNKELLKQKICNVIDENKDKICKIGQHIFENPELGYKEFMTSELVQKTFDELNLSYEKDLGITGVKAKLNDKEDEMKEKLQISLAKRGRIGYNTNQHIKVLYG